MTQKHLEISAAGKEGYGLLYSVYQAWHFCQHFNITGQTTPTKPSPLLYSAAAAGLYNHFSFCILGKQIKLYFKLPYTPQRVTKKVTKDMSLLS